MNRFPLAARLPLRATLVALTALLLAACLAIAGLATSAIQSRYLVSQVDDELLRTAASAPALSAVLGPINAPSDYYILIRDGGEDLSDAVWPPTRERFGTPIIPADAPTPNGEFHEADQIDEAVLQATEPPDDSQRRPGRGGGRPGEATVTDPSEPFTVRSTGGEQSAQWRVVATTVRLDPQTEYTVYVALPLASVAEANSRLTRTLLWLGLGLIPLGAGVAFWLVTRSLRPLRQIEQTAAAIASGDLSQRVAQTAPTTTEVGSLESSLNQMLAQVETAFATQAATNERQRRFVSDASHELRTPLATVRGYAELYRMGALPEAEVGGTMLRIEDAARRMGKLVEELLTLARLDEGRPLAVVPVDLTKLATDSAQDLLALDPTREVQVLEGGSDVVVMGDPDRLRQVLTNLIGNVARHTPAGSPVEIVVEQAPGRAVLEVRDHGAGISAAEQERIFERFYRADESRTRETGGSGLGLAIVAAIVGAHGGTVRALETPGGGLTIRIELPTE